MVFALRHKVYADHAVKDIGFYGANFEYPSSPYTELTLINISSV